MDALADSLAFLHAIVMVIYISGAVSVLRGGFLRSPLKTWQRFYLGIVFLMSVSVLFGDGCFLTQLENTVRAVERPEACYDCSFVEYYLPWLPGILDTVMSMFLLAAGCAAFFCTLWSQLHTKNADPSPIT